MSPNERLIRVLLFAISIVWVGNLLRNVLIIYLVDPAGPFGWDFDVVHGDLAKSMSFVILLGLAFVTFNLMPEMLDNISGIAELVKRKSPEERAIEAEKKEAEEREKEKGETDERDEEEADEGAVGDDEATGDGGPDEGGEPEEGDVEDDPSRDRELMVPVVNR
jgi:exosortase/archaeosortase family protein